MEFITKYLGPNKVTLYIKPNKFEETYDYPDQVYDRFNKVENIMDILKNNGESSSGNSSYTISPIKTNKQLNLSPLKTMTNNNDNDKLLQLHKNITPIYTTPTYNQKKQLPQSIQDKLLYSVLLSMDATLSLVPNKSDFIDKFKSDLCDKVINHLTKLKKYGYSKDDVINSIKAKDNADINALCYYLGILLEKSIAIDSGTNFKIYQLYSFDKSLLIYINNDDLKHENITKNECQNKMYTFKKFEHNKLNTHEKLMTYLVKDLKELGEDLGLITTKIDESGKKKNLLKAELLDIIKIKLLS